MFALYNVAFAEKYIEKLSLHVKPQCIIILLIFLLIGRFSVEFMIRTVFPRLGVQSEY